MTAVAMKSATVSPNPRSRLRPNPHRIRALIAENAPDPGVATYALLSLENRLEIIGRVTEGQEVMEAVSALQPDLLLIDVQMPHINAITVAAILCHRYPALQVILMSDHDSPLLHGHMHLSSAQFFVYKPQFVEEFNSLLPRIESAYQKMIHNEDVSVKE